MPTSTVNNLLVLMVNVNMHTVLYFQCCLLTTMYMIVGSNKYINLNLLKKKNVLERTETEQNTKKM